MKRIFESLDALLAYLQGLDTDEQERVLPQLDTVYDLPFMSGTACASGVRDPIWAWDSVRALVGDCVRDMSIEPRYWGPA